MDDYYEIVGVDRTATREEIDQKIREQLRLWQRRTANADLSRRQAAERRVEQLGQARTVLLDQEKRRQYDRQLTALHASDPVPAKPAVREPAPGGTGTALDPTTTTGTWLAQAQGYLAMSDHQSAAYAARAALRVTPNPPPEVWAVLARANTGLGRLDDALFEARQAVALAPGDLEAQLTLGMVYERRQEWNEAYQLYRNARRAHPHADELEVGMARALAGLGRPAIAMSELEQRYAQAPDRVRSGRTLARGLLEAAEVAIRPGAPGVERLAVTRMLARAREASADPDIWSVADRLEQQLDRVTGWHRYPPAGGGSPYGGGVYPQSRQRTNVLAVFALILSLLCFTAPVGAVLGHVARGQIRDRGDQGEGAALAAVIVGWLATAVMCCGGIAALTSN